ncbi:unnamed protein product [Spirodela intermedia]|uniref:Uncharacterized protein n=1 Tax=Spirodela intermedia TaxID=51605 RepID=A0A7I8JBK8_SPIIN|nr:unnamed protein product [Spirodela intermedia]CAA6667576.1 unnamed protein product [Spirodela intermedia]
MAVARKEVWRTALVLFLGQLVSLLLAVVSFTSSLIAIRGVDTPLTQSFFTYVSLTLVYGAVFLFRRQKLLVPWYWYLALAIVDVQGNYLVVKAYQYTSITSATLLDCWTIPWVIILTWFALGTRYSIAQFLGRPPKPLLGDMLVIAGTFFYAFSNVGEEFCVKKKDRVEVLAMLGLFGTLVSVGEISVFERKDLEAVKWSATMVALFAGFAIASALFYSVVPFVLKLGGATLFNLSLLTSDMWAIIIRVFYYRQKVDWLYYLAFGVEAIGLVTYSVYDASSTKTDLVDDAGYEALTEDTSETLGSGERGQECPPAP